MPALKQVSLFCNGQWLEHADYRFSTLTHSMAPAILDVTHETLHVVKCFATTPAYRHAIDAMLLTLNLLSHDGYFWFSVFVPSGFVFTHGSNTGKVNSTDRARHTFCEGHPLESATAANRSTDLFSGPTCLCMELKTTHHIITR